MSVLTEISSLNKKVTLMTLRETAELLNCSITTVRSKIFSKDIPPVCLGMIGKLMRVDREKLLRFISVRAKNHLLHY